MEKEQALQDVAQEQALHQAREVMTDIQQGPSPFYQAYDRGAIDMARRHGITENSAKSMMREAYEATEGRSLYDDGKEREEAYYRPVREAEIAGRKAEALERRNQAPQRSM